MKREQKGITLIALIITIIVMLILVGVTINVALNGGLFDKAKTASDGTQKEIDREALISAVIGTLDNNGKVVFDDGENNGLDYHLPEGFVGSNGTYTNTKNNKQYTVNEKTGKVEEKTNSPVSYSFKLGDLPTEGMTVDGDSCVYFDLEKVKDKLGASLFADDSKYMSIGEQEGTKYACFILEIDNNDILDGDAVNFGIASITEDTEYLISGIVIYDTNKFMLAIYTKDMDEVIGNENFGKIAWSEFVALYPNTTFTFMDLSFLQ